MLVNLKQTKFENLQIKKKNQFMEKFGSILDFDLPVISEKEDIEPVVFDYFTRIVIALDSCANEPKINAVCMNIQTKLEKRLMSMLVASDIEVLLSCL